MKNKLEKKQIIIKVAFIMLFLVFLSNIFSRSLWGLTLISFIQLLVSFYLLYKYLEPKKISLTSVFLILSYVFHVGQYILFCFKIDAEIPFNLLKLSTESEMLSALQFYILCHATIFCGIAVAYLYFPSEKLINNKLLFTKTKKCYLIIAIILILLGVVPKLYIDISKLILFLEGSYVNTYTLKTFGFIAIISHFFEFGIMMLLNYFKNNKKVSTIILFIAIFLEVPIFVSGNRGLAIIYILIYLYIYFFQILNINLKKIKLRYIIVIILIAHFGLSLINFISDYRSYPVIDSFGEAVQYYIPYIFRLSITDILGEFGGTMISTIYTQRFTPSVSGYGYGLGYLSGFLNIFPNIGGFINNFRESMVYVYSFPTEYQVSLGGSYIGELYYNFGYLSGIFSVFIGFIIGYLGKVFDQVFKKENSLLFIICLVFYVNILWWIRDYFSSMIREIIWFSAFIIILNIIIKKFSKRRKNGKN